MKLPYTKLLIVIALIGAAAKANAEYKISPDASLFVTADASLAYNDNIFLSQNGQKSDEVLDLIPGLLLTWGQSTDFKGNLAYNEDFNSYFSNSGLNAALANASLISNYDDGATKVDASASFHQVDQASRGIQTSNYLVHRNLSSVDLSGENALDAKNSVKLGFVYNDTEYRHIGYTNWAWYEGLADYYFKVAPKLDLSAGFTYKDNQLGTGGINSTEEFYNVGARGELAPKLTGEFSIGYNTIDLDGFSRRSAIGLDSKFTYAYSEKTTVIFGATNNSGYDAFGKEYKFLNIYAGFETVISEGFKVGAQLAYAQYGYTTESRTDNFYQGQINVTYDLSKTVSFVGVYSYSDNSSTLNGASFTGNIFSVAVKCRF